MYVQFMRKVKPLMKKISEYLNEYLPSNASDFDTLGVISTMIADYRKTIEPNSKAVRDLHKRVLAIASRVGKIEDAQKTVRRMLQEVKSCEWVRNAKT